MSGVIRADVAASCSAPPGANTVTLSVADQHGLVTMAGLTVNVSAETTPPVITCPADITQGTGAGRCSAVVNFTATATDNCDGALTPTCMPASGSTFSVGATTVTCAVQDSAGNMSNCSFTVTVNDTQAPAITCPANITATATSPGSTSVIVNYPAPMASDNCAIQSVVCTPPSGSAFPLGSSTVTCTATDTSGNTASCSFTVTTFDICLQDDTSSSRVLLWNSVTGDYRFCHSGTVITGRGTPTRQGNIFRLTQLAPDRRVTAQVDMGMNRGTASLQMPVGITVCSITDRDTRNNSCSCSVP